MTTILINEELGRIKNLFNYERGRVISEQDTAAPVVSAAPAAPVVSAAPAAPAAPEAPVATVEDLIKKVQTILNTKYGAKLTVDGKWGNLTQTSFETALKTAAATSGVAATSGEAEISGEAETSGATTDREPDSNLVESRK
jgi:hypothetical protein